MNYSKALIDLISEARRRAPSEDKPSIKLANPDVLFELKRIFHKSSDSVLQAVIKEAFHLAGDDWPDKLNITESDHTPQQEKRYVTKVYRGQTQLVEIKEEESASRKSKRIYRGQIVA